MTPIRSPARLVPLLVAAIILAACATATRTSLEASWIAPQPPAKPLGKIMIITVAGDEIAQEYFQAQLAKAMQAQGANAFASRRYFTQYTTAERARFERSIKESDSDMVLLARVLTVDVKSSNSPGYIIGPSGVPVADALGIYGAYAQYFYPGAYVQGTDASLNTVTVEASLYERKGNKLLWSARTKTANANQGDLSATTEQLVRVLVSAMERDNLL